VPWRGMGRTTSHREKMAVMETVVSTTMRCVCVDTVVSCVFVGGGEG
jgi:hypothetical protein